MSIFRALKQKGLKFALTYAFVSLTYLVFDTLYMPVLFYWFGHWAFVPLYPSILLANFGGVYLYRWFGEDVLFMEFGRSWLDEDNGKLVRVKQCLRRSDKLIFFALSVWPSPIASYLFFRKQWGEGVWRVFRCIALGAVYCTFVWGGAGTLVWFAVTSFFPGLK